MDMSEIPQLPLIIAIVAIIATGGGIYALTTSHQTPMMGNVATNQEQPLTDEQMMNNLGDNATDTQENINYEDSSPGESTEYFNSGSYDPGSYDDLYEPVDEPVNQDQPPNDNQYEEPADPQDEPIDNDNQDVDQLDDDNQDTDQFDDDNQDENPASDDQDEPTDNDDLIDDGSTGDQIDEPFDPLDDPGINPDDYDDLEEDSGEDGGSMEL